MTTTRIYHLCRQADWQQAMARGVYEGSEQDRADGFMHFSTAEQIEDSAAKHRAGEADLLLLAVDVKSLGESLRWEAASSGEVFPHLYAGLPVSAVLDAHPLPLGPGGQHEFPLLTD